jgi:transcriptional regulator with XRE-family HTH domain
MKAIDKVGSAFLRRILLRMKQLGVSQTELARRMKVSRPYVTKVLSRDVNFSFRTAAKLANALKMDFFPELREREEGDATGVNQTPVTAKLRKMV